MWTAQQTAQFLRLVGGHRLYALFHLVAPRWLRRGEAAGLRWADLDLDGGTLTVTAQLQQLGGRLVAGPPKSEAGRRVVALDQTTIAALRAHQARQRAERDAAGAGRTETGYVFTTCTGKPRSRRQAIVRPAAPPTRPAARLGGAGGSAPLALTSMALVCRIRAKPCEQSAVGGSWLRIASPEAGRILMGRKGVGSVYPRCGCHQGRAGARLRRPHPPPPHPAPGVKRCTHR